MDKAELKDDKVNNGRIRSILLNIKRHLLLEDLKDVENLYKEFIKNYNNNVNKAFNFTDPIQISKAYIFAYSKGYLSKDSKFTYTTNRDELLHYPDVRLIGSIVITGKGCCRHIAPLLTDIYEDYGYKSCRISVGLNQCNSKINFEGLTKSQLKVADLLLLADMSIDEKLSILHKAGIPTIEDGWDYDRKKVPQNHVITGVMYNDFAYYIDPTNKTYYRLDDESGCLISSSGAFENTIFYNGRFDSNLVKKLPSLPNVDFDSVKSIWDNTNLLCSNNLDLFEKFYKDNRELYEEITEKLKKI